MNIRPARVGDVPAIHELIRTFADRKLMIRRSLGELYESIREFIVATDDAGQVIGCAALHVFWEDLAELKCLAVSERAHGQGIGRGLVGLVAAEFFLSGSGIGLLIIRSSQDFDIPGLYAAILIVTILGVALMSVGRVLEHRFAAWRGLSR